MVELKEALTYDEQVDKLIYEHNLIVADREYAVSVLKKVNYYRLSAYGIGLKQVDDKEKYIDGITLESLYSLYEFDSKFKNILIHIIEQVEIQLRAQISNYFSLKYGPEGYTDLSNFIVKLNKDGENIHSNIIDNFRLECSRQQNVPFVKHHFKKYDGHFPMWVAVELFTFGNLSSLFDIMKDEDKKEIAKLYNTEPMHLRSWILALVEIRNICAHYGRLYNMPLKQTPFLYAEHVKYRNPKNNKVFPALLALKRMILSDSRWFSFYSNLEALFEEYSGDIKLSFIGFPCEWKDVLGTK